MSRKSITGSVVNADTVGVFGISLICFGFLFTTSLETSIPVEVAEASTPPLELRELELPLIRVPRMELRKSEPPKDITQPSVDEAPAAKAKSIKKVRIRYRERYETSADTRIVVWTWEGGATVRKDQLAQTIVAVHERLSIVPKNDALVSLILETSAAESLRGIYVEQKGGPAEGLFQMEPATERFMRDWLKKVFPKVYDEVMHFYESSKSAEWNRVYNVPYAIAMSTAYYWHRCGDSLIERIDTIEERAKLWKEHYNTPLGKGTTEGYLRKADKYL